MGQFFQKLYNNWSVNWSHKTFEKSLLSYYVIILRYYEVLPLEMLQNLLLLVDDDETLPGAVAAVINDDAPMELGNVSKEVKNTILFLYFGSKFLWKSSFLLFNAWKLGSPFEITV